MKKLLLASVALIAFVGTGPALAGAPSASDWTGWYAGLNTGYGWDQMAITDFFTDIFESDTMADFSGRSSNGNGWFYGGQIGWNIWQSGNLVFGVEGEIDFGNIHGSGVVTEEVTEFVDYRNKINSFESLRARVGWNNYPWLLYVTGGWGWASNRVEVFGEDTSTFASDKQNHTGFTFGGGIDLAWPSLCANCVAGLEYLYSDLGHKDYAVFFDDDSVALGARIGLKMQVVKVRLDYYFD